MIYKLSDIFSPYSEINSKNLYEPVAVGKYGIRRRSEIYKKELAKDYSKNKLIFKNTMTIGLGSTQIDFGVLSDDFIFSVSPAYSTFKINTDIVLPEYIKYWLDFNNPMLTRKYMIASARQGKKVDVVNLLNETIDIPNFERQRQLIAIMLKVESIERNCEQRICLYDEIVKSRFIEMFGMVGSDENGWGLTRLGDCCVINPKKSTDNRLCADLMVSFVPMPSISEKGEIDASAIKAYNEVKTGFTYFVEQDVLFAKITPCMENGKGAVAKGLCNGIGFGSTEFHVLRPIAGVSNPQWVYAVTAFEQFRIDASSNMTGSAGQRRVPASFLENYRVSVPPIELQNQFATFVEQTDKSKLATTETLEYYEELRAALMNKYFGENNG